MIPVSLKTIFARLFDAMDRRDGGTAYVVGQASCAPTAHAVASLQVDVAAGPFVSNANGFATFAGGNKTPAAAILNPHVDLIYIDAGGVLQIGAGAEAASNPVPPTLPAGALGIALVFVPPGAIDYTAATSAYIFDIRQFNAPMYLPDGTAPAPSLPFGNEIGTGVFRPAAARWGISISGTPVVDVGVGYVAVGTNPAASGVFRIPNNSSVTGRNAANSANKQLVKLNASDIVELDSDAVGVSVVGAFVQIATTPALSGVLRIPNNTVVRARNAANSADLDLISLNGSNKVVLSGQAPGADGTVLTADAATTGGMKWAAAATTGLNVQTFTGNGTWTKPAGSPKCVLVIEWGGGGGGGGGDGHNGGQQGGGAGGGGAVYQFRFFDPSALGATETVTVAAGGTPGTSGNGANGGGGGLGGTTTFGTQISAPGGNGGSGGVGGTSGTGGLGGTFGGGPGTGGNGGNGGAGTGTAGAAGVSSVFGGPGGGGGSGEDSTGGGVNSTGGAGGTVNALTTGGGGAGGAAGGGAGTAGTSRSLTGKSGDGGGGGGGRNVGALAGAGGDGGAPGGAAGGGGAGASGGGPGGTGARGEVLVYTFF